MSNVVDLDEYRRQLVKDQSEVWMDIHIMSNEELEFLVQCLQELRDESD